MGTKERWWRGREATPHSTTGFCAGELTQPHSQHSESIALEPSQGDCSSWIDFYDALDGPNWPAGEKNHVHAWMFYPDERFNWSEFVRCRCHQPTLVATRTALPLPRRRTSSAERTAASTSYLN
jgi:hypothetical protein